jgi:hypothetical protein
MRSAWGFWATAMVLAFAADGLRADDVFTRSGHAIARDCKRNNYWPEPFIYPDRDAVVRPFGVMIAKGWQVQNTLSEHHFQPDNSRLADAGVHKVHQILSDPVAQRRIVFVQMAGTPEQTIARIAAVRGAAAVMLPPGAELAVYPSGIQTRPWLGTEVLGVHVSYDKMRADMKSVIEKVGPKATKAE